MSAEAVYTQDLEAEVDEFERKDFAKRIAKTVLDQPLSHSSLVVSIVGPWGSGKSTVLKYIEAELAGKPCKTAIFNPWRYAGEDALLFHLFEALVTAIDGKSVLNEWQKMMQAASKASDFIGTGAAAAADALKPGSGVLVKSLLSMALPKEFKLHMEKIREQARAHLEKTGKRIIMPIDDVDRLDPHEILLLFRALKLIADLPNTTFIIAMDEEHVSQVIGKHIDGNPDTGRRYIEKIVNVRLSLPEIPDHILETHTLKKLSLVLNKAGRELTASDAQWVRYLFHRLHAPFIKTPRKVKSLKNGLSFALGLLPSDEVNTGDVILLEATRILHPELYQKIQDIIPHLRGAYHGNHHRQQELNDQYSQERWDCLLTSFKHSNSLQKDDIKISLGAWFPQLNSPNINDRDDWREKKRICSTAYFWRYFSGAIQKDDVRDVIVHEWVERTIENWTKCVIELHEHLVREYASAFLQKLQKICEHLPTPSLPILLALAHTSSRLPAVEVDPLIGDARSNSFTVIASLMDKAKDPEKWDDVMMQLIKASGDLEWSLHLWRALPDQPSQEKAQKPVAKYIQELARQCVLAYETENTSKHGLTISLMAGIMILAASQSAWKKNLRKLVNKRPYVTLHLLTWGCGLGIGHENAKCWRWFHNSQTKIEAVLGKALLKRSLQSLAGPPPNFKPPASDYDYITLEEVGWTCLESIRKREVNKKNNATSQANNQQS